MSSPNSEPATVDAIMTGAQAPQLLHMEVKTVRYRELRVLEIVYDGPVLEMTSARIEDRESTDEQDKDDDKIKSAENPEWFNHCCISDHVRYFKAEQKSFGGGHASVVLRESLLWEPGQEITYTFLGGTTNRRLTVKKGMEEWMRYANIKFKEIPFDRAAKSHVRISFNPKDGNWSRLGLNSLDYVTTKATANFCDINEELEATERQKGVVLHEIGHILGLEHEHQSPSLRGLLTWIEEEVKKYFAKKCQWTDDQTQAEVLDSEDSTRLTSYTHLDLQSIMMYPMPKSTNRFGLGKKGIDIPENTCLSPYDKAFIGIVYPFFNEDPHKPPRKWTFEHSLKQVGCDKDKIEFLMPFFKQGDWKSIRRMFEGVYSTARAIKTAELFH